MRRWLLFIVVCLFSVGADAAQGLLRRGVPKYDFISDTLNKIIHRRSLITAQDDIDSSENGQARRIVVTRSSRSWTLSCCATRV